MKESQPRNNDDTAGVDELEEASIRHVVTPERIQYLGLRLVGYKRKRLQKSTAKVNYERFKAFFGVSPVTAAEIYHDMQATDIEEAKIDGSRLDLRNLFIGLHYLFKYPTERYVRYVAISFFRISLLIYLFVTSLGIWKCALASACTGQEIWFGHPSPDSGL